MPRKSSRCAIVNLRGMGAPGSDRWVVLTCFAACSTGRISCRQMALTLHWGVARDAVAERCASGRAAALQHLVVARKDFIQADCILFTIQVKHRERTCARCVNVIHHDLSLFGGRGPRWSTSFSCHYGKASGMWTSIGDWVGGVRERGCGHCGALESGGGRGTARVNDCRL